MQNFNDIPGTELQSDSLPKMMANYRTIMSSNSGTAFPTTELQLGMLCHRTNAPTASGGLYELIAITPSPTWSLLRDWSKTVVDKEYVDAGLNTKQATITGAATTVASVNLAASKALASDGGGKIVATSVTATELGHLTGIAANVQNQLNDRPTNAQHALKADAASLGAYPLLDGSRQFTGWVSIRNAGPYTAYRDTDNNVVWLVGTDGDELRIHRAPGVDGGGFVQMAVINSAGQVWTPNYGWLHDRFGPHLGFTPPLPPDYGWYCIASFPGNTVPGTPDQTWAWAHMHGNLSSGGMSAGGQLLGFASYGNPLLFWRIR